MKTLKAHTHMMTDRQTDGHVTQQVPDRLTVPPKVVNDDEQHMWCGSVGGHSAADGRGQEGRQPHRKQNDGIF